MSLYCSRAGMIPTLYRTCRKETDTGLDSSPKCVLVSLLIVPQPRQPQPVSARYAATVPACGGVAGECPCRNDLDFPWLWYALRKVSWGPVNSGLLGWLSSYVMSDPAVARHDDHLSDLRKLVTLVLEPRVHLIERQAALHVRDEDPVALGLHVPCPGGLLCLVLDGFLVDAFRALELSPRLDKLLVAVGYKEYVGRPFLLAGLRRLT